MWTKIEYIKKMVILLLLIRKTKELPRMMYHINEHIWKQIYNFLCMCKGIHKSEMSLRRFIEGIWYMARSGCQWRLLPPCYGKWRSIHKKFKRWENRGIWNDLFEYIQIEPDTELFMIDATIVRAHQCAAGYKKDSQVSEALGRSHGGFSTKIHALVDALGNPIKFILTAGQRQEITQAENLLQNINNTTIIGDKGYDSNACIDFIKSKNSEAVIPSRKNRNIQRPYDKHLYIERHLIECFFGKIKHFRRIFSRFDKAASTYLAFIQFVSVFIWLR